MNPVILTYLLQCDKIEFDPVYDEITFLSTKRNIIPYSLDCIPKKQYDIKIWKNFLEDFLLNAVRDFNIKHLDVYGFPSKKIIDYCDLNGVKLCAI